MSLYNDSAVDHSLRYGRNSKCFHSSPSYPPSNGGITLAIILASSKEDKIKTATILLRKSKFQGDKRIVIHHPYKPALPSGPPPVAGAAQVSQKEEDGYDEVFKLP